MFRVLPEGGQGLVEYAMILLFVTLVLIVLLTILGPQVVDLYDKAISCPGGFFCS